jgi:hypothetical protein
MLKTTRDMMLPTAITGPTRARCGSTAASTPPPPDVPSRSPADNLENLLAALGRQSVRAGRLIIAVESPDDPGCSMKFDFEWTLFEQVKLPEGKIIVPGVIE